VVPAARGVCTIFGGDTVGTDTEGDGKEMGKMGTEGKGTTIIAGLAAAAVTAALFGAPGTGARGSDAEVAGAAGPSLAELGVEVTGGAVPGYVDDRLCGSCHRDLYRSFQAVGMARSFYPPSEAEWIEDFDAEPFYHPESRRYYEMRRTGDGDGGDGLRFRRYQLDDDGAEVNVLEQEVDWVLGSGHRSRTYLFRTENGELYQLPVAWYTQEGAWAMAPGFDHPRHLGINRLVRRECMFCHNAYPEMPAGSDGHLQPHVFPAELPHGIGCQRCHGPGGEHVRLAFAEEIDFKALAASIVDPAELAPERQREVCYQCHMQPSVALMGVRRFGRRSYSYRPGEPLSEYLVQIDVEEEGVARDERFEINHHAYRLEQSPCFEESAGALSCLTCHDPHRKVPPAERAAHYRDACFTCHQLDDCDLDEMVAAADGAPSELPEGVAADDCAGCHMPQHRPRDVVHVVMTDHLIRRTPGGEELVAPLEESTPVIVDAELMAGEGAPEGALAEVYRAVTVLRAGGNREAGEWLEKNLPKVEPEGPEPYLDLGVWQLQRRRPEAAAASFREVLERRPDVSQAVNLLAVATTALGEREEALALAREALEIDPERSDLHFNLGRLLLGYRSPEAALPHLRRAVELRSNLAAGWYYLGVALGEGEEAVDALRRALAVEPSFTDAYLTLARLLVDGGNRAEALRYLRHGARVAADGEAVAELLARVEAAPEESAPPPPASR